MGVLAFTHADTVNIDVDSMDPIFASKMQVKPHNHTSNQLIVNEQISVPEAREMFLQAVKEYKDQDWEAVLTRIVCPYPKNT